MKGHVNCGFYSHISPSVLHPNVVPLIFHGQQEVSVSCGSAAVLHEEWEGGRGGKQTVDEGRKQRRMHISWHLAPHPRPRHPPPPAPSRCRGLSADWMVSRDTFTEGRRALLALVQLLATSTHGRQTHGQVGAHTLG